jgi:hypothetical protein
MFRVGQNHIFQPFNSFVHLVEEGHIFVHQGIQNGMAEEISPRLAMRSSLTNRCQTDWMHGMESSV